MDTDTYSSSGLLSKLVVSRCLLASNIGISNNQPITVPNATQDLGVLYPASQIKLMYSVVEWRTITG